MDKKQAPPERDLNQAGSIVDKSIEYMMGQNITPLAIASALLGGAMGVLCRTLPDDVVVQILNNAIESVESGDMRAQAGKDHAGEA
jgi:large-conductance mechanosensitive channel